MVMMIITTNINCNNDNTNRYCKSLSSLLFHDGVPLLNDDDYPYLITIVIIIVVTTIIITIAIIPTMIIPGWPPSNTKGNTSAVEAWCLL